MGFLIPMGTAGVVSSFPKRIGYASGLLGFFQLGVAALSASMINFISANSIARLGAYVLLAVTLGFVIYHYLARRR